MKPAYDFIPVDISLLRRWFPVLALPLIVAVFADWLRADETDLLRHSGALLGLGLCWVGAISRAVWAPWITSVFAFFALFLLVSTLEARVAPVDVWALVVVAPLLVFSTLCISFGTTYRWWTGQALSIDQLQEGFARNRAWERPSRALGQHVVLLHAALATLLPIVWILDVAISPGNALGGAIGDAFTTEHFEVLLTDPEFWLWTRNSIIVAVGTTVFGLALAIPAGYALSRYRFSGHKETLFLFMLVQMFPGAMIIVPFFLVMKTLGLLNSSLSLIIVYSVTTIPLCVFMLKSYFDSIPYALEEAAQLDGCSQFTVLWRIILPLSLPALLVTGLFSFLSAWNEFLLALVFNTDNSQFTLPVGLASMIPSTGQRWGDFAAASILVSAPVVILFFLFQRALIGGMSAGSVKG